jgi:type IV pilus assembly protein PilB
MPKFDDSSVNARLEELRHSGEESLVRALAPKQGYQYINLHGVTIDPGALRILSEQDARKAEVAIFEQGRNTVSVAIRNPNNPATIEALKKLKSDGHDVHVFMASFASIEHAWERYKDTKQSIKEKKGVLDVNPDVIQQFSNEIKTHLDVATKIHELGESGGTERISRTIEIIFGGALALNASDIHIEPEQSSVRLRYRLDGVLWDISDIEADIYAHISSRLKLLSGLKLNVRDEAQDGRFTFDVGEHELEVRTSVIPGGYGESIVMRLLDPNASTFKLENLGLNERLYEVMQEELARPNGAIITTGPTGSGKTTALYAFMQQIHTPEKKIVTIEDPIEYKLPGIVQTQVGDDYTFESGLRAILRQDPDVIMIGEIRDREVAETAVHAALTGHLVFSTLHTNSAVGAFPRLIDLGVDDQMIGSAVNVILGQRLVRKLCEHCKKQREATTEEQKLITRILRRPVATHMVYEAPGCSECGESGYKGRVGIYEAIVVDKAVEEAMLRDRRENSILSAASSQNIPSMQQDGVLKVLSGVTSLEELSRVTDLYNTKNIVEEPAPDDQVSASV